MREGINIPKQTKNQLDPGIQNHQLFVKNLIEGSLGFFYKTPVYSNKPLKTTILKKKGSNTLVFEGAVMDNATLIGTDIQYFKGKPLYQKVQYNRSDAPINSINLNGETIVDNLFSVQKIVSDGKDFWWGLGKSMDAHMARSDYAIDTFVINSKVFKIPLELSLDSYETYKLNKNGDMVFIFNSRKTKKRMLFSTKHGIKELHKPLGHNGLTSSQDYSLSLEKNGDWIMVQTDKTLINATKIITNNFTLDIQENRSLLKIEKNDNDLNKSYPLDLGKFLGSVIKLQPTPLKFSKEDINDSSKNTNNAKVGNTDTYVNFDGYLIQDLGGGKFTVSDGMNCNWNDIEIDDMHITINGIKYLKDLVKLSFLKTNNNHLKNR